VFFVFRQLLNWVVFCSKQCSYEEYLVYSYLRRAGHIVRRASLSNNYEPVIESTEHRAS
jgi:hypothetical protein